MAAKKKAARRGGFRKGAGRKPVLKNPVRLTNFFEEAALSKLQSEAKAKDVTVGELLRSILGAHLKRRRK
jgi:hypothetical protein